MEVIDRILLGIPYCLTVGFIAWIVTAQRSVIGPIGMTVFGGFGWVATRFLAAAALVEPNGLMVFLGSIAGAAIAHTVLTGLQERGELPVRPRRGLPTRQRFTETDGAKRLPLGMTTKMHDKVWRHSWRA